MRITIDSGAFTVTDMHIALCELYLESSYGAVPVLTQYEELNAYRAFDGGGLEAVAPALAAYVDFQQHERL